jgi:hypothetical protein
MLRRRNAHGGIRHGQGRIMQVENNGNQASGSARDPRIVTEFASIPQIIPNVPNYQLFHSIIAYNQGGLCTPQEVAGIEQRFFDDHQSRYKDGYSVGIRTYYAPDERTCCVSRDLVDFQLIVPCIEKVCIGVMHGWNVGQVHPQGCERVSLFSEADQVECTDMGRKMCSCVNMTTRDIFSRIFSRTATNSDALPLLGVDVLLRCDARVVLLWCASVFKWIQECYALFPSTSGLLLYRKQADVRDSMEDRDLLNFQDSMTHLLVYRLERVLECMADVEKDLDAWNSVEVCTDGAHSSGEHAGVGGSLAQGKRTADCYNKYLYRVCKSLTVLQMDAINRATTFYEPAVRRHALPYIKSCLLQRPPQSIHNSSDVSTLLR